LEEVAVGEVQLLQHVQLEMYRFFSYHRIVRAVLGAAYSKDREGADSAKAAPSLSVFAIAIMINRILETVNKKAPQKTAHSRRGNYCFHNKI
jgi:hypothetical protein